MTAEVAFLSAAELTAAYAAGTLSPVEATDAALTQIERHNPALNAFCLVDDPAARAAARDAETRWRNGTQSGSLDGVPVSIKDLVLTRGWPTLRGSRTIDPAGPWDEDGPAVARLREAGAVLLGKTTTPEFAFKPITNSPLTGITRNPWDVSMTPGGSSGGAAAAVAAGMGPLALGTDAGGSIRIPASFSGVFGLKPSGGRVPTYPPTPLASLVGFGPITRTVEDAARMLEAIARPDPRDWTAAIYDPAPYASQLDADPARWRIAYSPTFGFADVDPEVAALAEAAATVFAGAGATVDRVEQIMDDPAPLMTKLRRGFTAFAFRNFGPEQMALMDPDVVAEIEDSQSADLMAHMEAEMARAELGRAMIALHQTYDFILSPTLAVPPFSAGIERPAGHTRYSWTSFCVPFNLTRQPAASVPCGFTAANLPVGLQIVGPPHADLAVLQAARAFEIASPWRQHRPSLPETTR
ncbi:amidase [Acuticoccus sp. MNP-M23]|uniref:amidase n=1 Tax=Acuticoccus sp. MNP-M23 TaxID=3072793 RepID=UPI002815D435|nr:amidase [Acuticoccus sp. MNP-M23]WMS44132.1 amidase [Acuticoccus sp. MNP-M23]